MRSKLTDEDLEVGAARRDVLGLHGDRVAHDDARVGDLGAFLSGGEADKY